MDKRVQKETWTEAILNSLGIVVTIVVIVAVTLFLISALHKSTAKKADDYCCTVEVVVSSGDNLTRLIERNSFPDSNGGRFDMREVIRVTRSLNGWDEGALPSIYPKDIVIVQVYCGEGCNAG